MVKRFDINSVKNKTLLNNYAKLTDKDMFYLEGKSDEFVNKVQSIALRDTREILYKRKK